MSVQRIASRYAKSLLDLAIEENKVDRILEDIQSFGEVVKNRDFYLMLKSPIINATKKTQIAKLIFEGKFDKMTMAFLNILFVKGREGYMPEIAAEFLDQYKKLKHISTVRVTSAVALKDEVLASLRKKLEQSSDTDEKVEIVTKVDPDLIGGLVIEFEDKVYDASLSHKLDQLKKEFSENLYISQIVSK
ncbi:MAG: ATP synthase subunit delta [Saprospiraceae bacterium]|nr:MAG: ATP synthase subunit delta [Saprospiraceae bacterium]